MKIATWNVNGYRAILRKGALNAIRELQPDVLCLQEVKAGLEVLSEEQRRMDGYETIWYGAARPGYSGVATFSRIPPLETRLGMGLSDFDPEGRLILTRFADFTLLNVYFPSGQRGHDRVAYKLEFYSAVLDLTQALRAAGQEVVITGDFNTCHQEIDLARPRENRRTSGFLPEERAWIDRYLADGFVDAYRALYPEKQEYTWWSQVVNARERNIGWRLDYFLVTEGLMPRVRDVTIHGQVVGSDHCPVSMEIEG